MSASSPIIDLRSDTLTKPSARMRAAMAAAEVGDDVYGEDPTVNRLEARAAELFGREAAIFVPTGSMGNQIAIKLHTRSGQEIICESRAHILDWEMATLASYAGCMPRTVAAPRGVLTWELIRSAIAPAIYYRAQTGLIEVENSHNMAGGTVTPLDHLLGIWAGADSLGIPTHCDGARIFNAAAALQLDVQTITSGFSSVQFCLSKGLGAPVGSMLVGSRDFIAAARSQRKALGGGMRQAGILAAAGLMALEENVARLNEDHSNARLLAETVAQAPGVRLDMETVQTNIVIFHLEPPTPGSEAQPLAPAFVQALAKEHVFASAIGPNSVRFVTHLDVSMEDCRRAASVAVQTLEQTLSPA